MHDRYQHGRVRAAEVAPASRREPATELTASSQQPGGRSRSGWRVASWSLPLAVAMLPAAGRAETLSMAAFTNLAARCGGSVAASTLAAVAKTESNFRTLVVSDNTSRRARNFNTIDDAAAMADTLIGRGHSVDLGLMQINSANLRHLGYTPRDALDPCKSVSGGALILSRNFMRLSNVSDPQVALRHALSQYNTGNIRSGYRNGYVHRVEQAARTLLASTNEHGPVRTLERFALPLARRSLAVDWNIWNSSGGTRTHHGLSQSEDFIVF